MPLQISQLHVNNAIIQLHGAPQLLIMILNIFQSTAVHIKVHGHFAATVIAILQILLYSHVFNAISIIIKQALLQITTELEISVIHLHPVIVVILQEDQEDNK